MKSVLTTLSIWLCSLASTQLGSPLIPCFQEQVYVGVVFPFLHPRMCPKPWTSPQLLELPGSWK